MTWPLVTRFGTEIPGDSFDGWQNYWNLWWVKTAVLEQHTQPWFTDLLYHPTGVGLLFHTLNAFNGFAFLPVQLAFGLIPAYNAVVLFSFAAGGLGAYLLARQVLGPGAGRLAPFLAGVVFTFSPYHVAHLLGHMQLIALEWIPFFALYLVRTTERLRRRDAAMALLFLSLVALCDWYYVMYCAILTAIVVVWRAVDLARKRRAGGVANRRALQGIGLVAGVWLAWGVVFSPLLAPMVGEALRYNFMQPNPEQFRILSADLLAFVTPQEFHPVWGEWARERAQVFLATVSEHQVFAGFATLALAALGALFHRGRRLGVWVAVALVFFVLSLGPVLHVGGETDVLPGGRELPLPYGLLQGLPFLNISRSISRFDAVIMLALGVLAAGGLAWLRGRTGATAGRWIGVAAIAVVAFEFLPAPYPMSPPDTPPWYRTLARDERSGAVLNLPVNWDRPWYLLYQTEHGKPLTAAYISREDPRTLIDRAPVLSNFRHLGPDVIMLASEEQGRQVLADLDVRWVVLDRYKMPGGLEREATEAGARALFGEQAPVYQDERLTVYEVERPAGESPYPILGVGWSTLDKATRTRSFTGSAPLTIQSPGGGQAVLRMQTTAESAALSLPRAGDGYELMLTLQPGANEVTINAVEPGARAVVSSVTVR